MGTNSMIPSISFEPLDEEQEQNAAPPSIRHIFLTVMINSSYISHSYD